MTKLTLLALVLTALAFTAAWFLFPDVSSLPLCWFTSASLCGMFYAIDRIGFAKLDTLDMLYDNPWVYTAYMAIYAVLIISGHIIGFGVIG